MHATTAREIHSRHDAKNSQTPRKLVTQMTKTLVIYVHPVEGSFNSAVRDAVVHYLSNHDHQVRLRDLYAENFHPFLSAT